MSTGNLEDPLILSHKFSSILFAAASTAPEIVALWYLFRKISP